MKKFIAILMLAAMALTLTASAVKMRLKRGREVLQKTLAKEDIHV